MSAIAGSSDGTPPSVPRPKLNRQQNLNALQVEQAFNDGYWLRRTGNWREKTLMQNILTAIQKICELVLDEYEKQFSNSYPTYLRQTTNIKKEMYSRFLELLEENPNGMGEADQVLILEMMKAAEPLDVQEKSHGRHWLFEYCIHRSRENRLARAKVKDPHARKRHRGVVYYEGDSGGSGQ